MDTIKYLVRKSAIHVIALLFPEQLSCSLAHQLVELAKLLLILPTSPILKVDESTGILSRSVASSICRIMLTLIILIVLIIIEIVCEYHLAMSVILYCD